MSKGADLSFDTTLLVRDTCLCLHLQRAARATARRFDDALRPLGLNNGQFSLLVSLNRSQPPTIGSVASLLGMDRTTLTAALKPLVRRGLIGVKADPNDRRGRLLTLTAAGRRLAASAVPVWKRTQHAFESMFESLEPQRLREDLRVLS